MKKLLSIILLSASAAGFSADQIQKNAPKIIRYAEGITIAKESVKVWPEDQDAKKQKVKIDVLMASNPNGTAVLLCPGGGYGVLCASYEGYNIAKLLNRYGVTGIVLHYRVQTLYPAPLEDAQQAMRIIRANAAKWKINPKKIGVMGFSAGGHVASLLATHYDLGKADAAKPLLKYSCRPDFQALIYPVITMGPKTHGGSRNNLLGPNPVPELIKLTSNELQVNKNTPPAFLAHSVKDSLVPVANSQDYVKALKANNVPVEYLEMADGPHGLGCGQGKYYVEWSKAFLKWMKKCNFLNDVLERTEYTSNGFKVKFWENGFIPGISYNGKIIIKELTLSGQVEKGPGAKGVSNQFFQNHDGKCRVKTITEGSKMTMIADSVSGNVAYPNAYKYTMTTVFMPDAVTVNGKIALLKPLFSHSNIFRFGFNIPTEELSGCTVDVIDAKGKKVTKTIPTAFDKNFRLGGKEIIFHLKNCDLMITNLKNCGEIGFWDSRQWNVNLLSFRIGYAAKWNAQPVEVPKGSTFDWGFTIKRVNKK